MNLVKRTALSFVLSGHASGPPPFDRSLKRTPKQRAGGGKERRVMRGNKSQREGSQDGGNEAQQ